MAMFSRTLRLKSTFSCSTTPTWRRSCAASIRLMSVPSTRTRPCSGTYRRWMSLASVLFPLPLRPTMPIISPARTSRLTPCSTGGASGL